MREITETGEDVNESNCLVIPERSVVPLVRSSQQLAITDSNCYNLFDEDDDKKKSSNGKTPMKKTQSNICDSLSVVLSHLYSKFILVLGLALPITNVISKSVPVSLYNGFYIYLYGCSIAFILGIHLMRIKMKFLKKFKIFQELVLKLDSQNRHEQKIENHASFYLRLGAGVFGIGSMVYAGLEMGEYLLYAENDCNDVTMIIKPSLRIIFTILQLNFIFLKDTMVISYQGLMRYGLSHLFAANVCEWLNVIVEETIHELDHHSSSHENSTVIVCHVVQGDLARNASSYLFPCTIEYSLICAVTLMEMWKEIHIRVKKPKKPQKQSKKSFRKSEKQEHSMDCTHSNKGLVVGLLITVFTLICLIVFFSIRTDESFKFIANNVIVMCESFIYITSLVAMAIAVIQMRHLPYCIHRINSEGSLRMGLDLSLLLKAQAGVYMYHIFSLLACLLCPPAPVWPDLFSILQTTLQTLFILDTWWKRSHKEEDQISKPGRQIITFLRMVNISLWIINTTEKNKAQLRPVQLEFYGNLTWIIITHLSMPLAIFYRFHSTICFFEIWRNSYKGVRADVDQKNMFI